jgi:hypothetical protein
VVALTEVRIRPEELQAGATGFAGHADTLATYANAVNDVAGALPTAFAGFDVVAGPIMATLGELADGVGQTARQVGALGSAVAGTGSQATEVDQQNSRAIG